MSGVIVLTVKEVLKNTPGFFVYTIEANVVQNNIGFNGLSLKEKEKEKKSSS